MKVDEMDESVKVDEMDESIKVDESERECMKKNESGWDWIKVDGSG